jgi:hypothetical protein
MRWALRTLAVALVAAGCGSSSTVTVTTTQTTTAPPGEKTVRVYFLRDGKVGPVARSFDSVTRAALLEAQAAGPTAKERAIGFDPGEATEKLGATVYTLSQFDPLKPVVVDGTSYRRSDFEALTPAILVEGPLPFAAVSAPLRLWGTANTFEATFEYDLLDPAGSVLSQHFVTATSGTGTRGTYDVTIPFEAPNGLGKLVVYERSAADGSKTHVVEIPLTLAK